MSDDFRERPPNLPVPVDDGAANHLPGTAMPALVLDSTAGPIDLTGAGTSLLVLYVYPRTGKPGEPLPPGWDDIPGARGCTPESCGFRDHQAELAGLGASVLGLSAQPLADQREFAERERIPYPVLSDPELRLGEAIGLPTFDVAGMRLYRRITLIVRDGTIAHAFYPVFPPDRHAKEVVSWLARDVAGE